MALEGSPGREIAAHDYENYSGHERNGIELSHISTNTYESLQGSERDRYRYNDVNPDMTSINADPSPNKVSETSKVMLSQCKMVALAVFGVLLLCTLTSTISGIIVYHVVTAKMEDNGGPVVQEHDSTETWADQMDSLRSNISRTDELLADMTGRLDQLNTDVQTIQTKHNVTSGIVTPIVAFKARNVISCSIGKNVRIMYTISLVNEGEAYNNRTALFTAPYDGLYTFNVQVCTAAQKWLGVHIKASKVGTTLGTVIGTVINYGNEYNATCTSGEGMAMMKVGDLAYVIMDFFSPEPDKCLYETEGIWNSFSGELVHITV